MIQTLYETWPPGNDLLMRPKGVWRHFFCPQNGPIFSRSFLRVSEPPPPVGREKIAKFAAHLSSESRRLPHFCSSISSVVWSLHPAPHLILFRFLSKYFCLVRWSRFADQGLFMTSRGLHSGFVKSSDPLLNGGYSSALLVLPLDTTKKRPFLPHPSDRLLSAPRYQKQPASLIVSCVKGVKSPALNLNTQKCGEGYCEPPPPAYHPFFLPPCVSTNFVEEDQPLTHAWPSDPQLGHPSSRKPLLGTPSRGPSDPVSRRVRCGGTASQSYLSSELFVFFTPKIVILIAKYSNSNCHTNYIIVPNILTPLRAFGRAEKWNISQFFSGYISWYNIFHIFCQCHPYPIFFPGFLSEWNIDITSEHSPGIVFLPPVWKCVIIGLFQAQFS